MFCGCELCFGEPPNTHTCPVCLGLPGALPVANAEAIHFGLMIGMALGCELAPRSIFHRKNYFYPDLPKGYQISQYDEPLCRGGRLGDVRIHRVHLEEDAAKLVHVGASGRIHGSDASIVDFNRGGTPLAEIVTEPDVRSAEQAREWLRLLRTTLRQLGVSDVNMEEGSLRCDANISIRPAGSAELGTKTELKNMNSFRFIERGINAEIARQEAILRGGGAGRAGDAALRPAHRARSRRCAPRRRRTTTATSPSPTSCRSRSPQEMLDRARAALPELPAARAERFERELGPAAPTRARLLAFRAELGDFFEAALAADGAPSRQPLANWVANELVARIGDADPPARRSRRRRSRTLVGAGRAPSEVTPGAGQAGARHARRRRRRPRARSSRPRACGAMGGGDELDADRRGRARRQPRRRRELRGGDMKPIGVIIGHVMRETQGRADGGEVTRLVRAKLGL